MDFNSSLVISSFPLLLTGAVLTLKITAISVGLGLVIGLVAGIFIVWMLRSRPGEKLFGFAMASILGGALGNVLDRLLHGYVVDMLDFHWRWLEPLFHGGHFPAFNIADTAITIGAACLILDEILRVRRSR